MDDLSGGLCAVVGGRLVARHLRVDTIDGLFACWVGFEHDAALRKRYVGALNLGIHTGMWDTTRIIRTAHEEKGVHGIFLCLLARHTQDAWPWGSRSTGPTS